MEPEKSWLALSLIPGLGGRTGKLLLKAFGSAEGILAAGTRELEALPGVGPRVSNAIRKGPDRERLDEEWGNVRRAGAGIVGLGDPAYPPLLFEIPDPPPVLYVLGRPLAADRPRVAIVGTRRPTQTGLSLAGELARDLAVLGVEVVSGMARGIDSAAHMGALEGGGSTIAVLGCGIDVLYPMRRRDLRNDIAARGTLVSEFPMKVPPLPEYFPRRNRIISGLSWAVVVVEAAARSGALLTADLALDQGREVMAVPGDPRSRVAYGPNRLIQEGAKLVMSSADVLEELPFVDWQTVADSEKPVPPEARGEEERQILEAVPAGGCLVDEIAEKTGRDVSVVLERLLRMELRGLVRRTDGARYERTLGQPGLFRNGESRG